MSENDLIAEYVKEKCPEILETFDFAVFKLNAACREASKVIAEAIKKIDFSAAQDAINKLTPYLNLAYATDPQLLSCTGCKYEHSTDIIEHVKFCNFCKRDKTDEEAKAYHEDLYKAKEE